MKLSILIVNWKSKDYLRRCLRTVDQTCSELSPQIVVVDGGSFDGCGEMLAAEYPNVEFVQSGENIGFGRSNNLGFEMVKGAVLLLLNPDTELKVGAVQNLLGALEGRREVGLVGPKLLNSDGTLQIHCVRALPTPLNRALDSDFLRRLLPRSRLWGVGEAFRARSPVEVEAVSGACMMLRSEVFQRVGGFSPDFFMYGEDMDLCAKVRRLKLAVLHVPAAEVVHHGGGSSGKESNFSADYRMRVAWETYMRLNHGPGTARWFRGLQAVSALLRVGLLLPACVFSCGARRESAKESLKKWRYIFRWAIGRIGKANELNPAGRTNAR